MNIRMYFKAPWAAFDSKLQTGGAFIMVQISFFFCPHIDLTITDSLQFYTFQ